MPAGDRSIELLNISLNLFTVNVIRIAEYEYIRYTHLQTMDACIERDSWGESNSIPGGMAHRFVV
jgi:hypothetical protein